MTYPGQRPEPPSLSRHFLLICRITALVIGSKLGDQSRMELEVIAKTKDNKSRSSL